MRFLLYFTFLNVFFADWLAFKIKVIPRIFTWVPEFASIIITLYILFKWSTEKRFDCSIKYVFLVVFLFITILCGFLLNGVSSGVMISGMRIYLRYFPFFFLPAVWDIDSKQLLGLSKFILFLALLQLPIVIYQRFFKYKYFLSGDMMGGSLGANTSGVLSILLLLIVAACISFYVKEHIEGLKFAACLFALFIPTTMNETKVVLFLLPVPFLAPILFSKILFDKTGKVLALLLLLVTSVMVFRFVYDYFILDRWGYGILTFMTKEGRFEGYMNMRLVPIIKTFDTAFNDVLFFIFGAGAGNASFTFSPMFTGEAASKIRAAGFIDLGIITLIWELGFLGTTILLLILALLFLDAIKLASRKDVYGAIGLSMLAIIPIYTISLSYFNNFGIVIISMLFWLMSGVVASSRSRLWEVQASA